jgi:Putative beta-barrel porin-2, OmpL-like. bbp2
MNAITRLAFAASLATPGVVIAQARDSSAAPKAPSVSPVSVTGSVTTSFTSSTRALNDTIVGRLYDRRQNEFMLNVANLTVERLPATDRWEAGFHVEAWFGQNAAVVKAAGLNLGSEADIWKAYTAFNIPLSGTGRYLQIKGGKMATLMGVEGGEDVLNPNLDNSWQDIFLEPFTETGIEFDAQFSPRVDAEIRISNGWDQVTDVNHAKSVMARLGLTPDDKTLIALLGFVGPEQPNNTQNERLGAEALLSRKIGAASTAWLQLDYGQEAGAAQGGGQAKWYAAGAWLTYDVASTTSLALRGDYMNDRDGARTSGLFGFPVNAGQKVGSATATLNVKRWDHALIRPEIRYDHSTLPVFNANQSQLSFSVGLSYIF